MSGIRRRAAVSVLVLALGLGACGGGDGRDITDGARATLAPLVAGVRTAAESLDPAGAARALAEVRQEVERLRASGALGEERAQEILAAAADVESRLVLVPTTTTTTTTTPPTTVPPATQPTKPDEKGPKDETDDETDEDSKEKESGKRE